MGHLAMLLQMTEKLLRGALRELLENAVVVLEDGVIVCPRMVNDTAKSLKFREYGKQGGNPRLKLVVNPRDNHEGLTHIPDTRSQISSSLIEGGPVDDLKAAEEKLLDAAEKCLRKDWPAPTNAKRVIDVFRKDLTNAVGSHAPPQNAKFASIARLIIDGYHPITKILRPARDIANSLPQGYKVTSWNYYASAVSNKSEERDAS
jgi:hypothetical protein